MTTGFLSSEASMPRTRIENGKIIDVDPRKWTVDVQLEKGGLFESVPVDSAYFHQERGEGIYAMPEIGAHCLLLMTAAEGLRPQILTFTPLRYSNPGEDTSSAEDDHSAGRGPATPGDLFMHGRDGNFVRVRRGGMVEVGSNEGTVTTMFPVGNLIRSICANHELHVSGSVFRTNTLATPENADNGPTPIQMDIRLQEFAEKPPIIDVKAGHVVDDEGRRLADADAEKIVFRFLIFDQSAADLAEAANIPPSPDQAAVQIRFDREGNAEEIYQGRLMQQANGRRLYLTDTDIQLVNGDRQERITGSVDREVGGDVEEVNLGNRTIRARNRLVLDCEQLEIRERRERVTSLAGNRVTQIDGGSTDRVAGSRRESTGSSISSASVGDRVETTGGKHLHTVLHIAEPTSVLQNALADVLTVLDGKIRRHAQAGDIELLVGPKDAPLCKLKLHNNPLNPTEIGRLSVEWANPAQQLIIDGITGTIQYKNTLGEWLMDTTGRSHIGSVSRAGAGNVVTTATHPVDYITGAPILGSTYLTVSGPPAPGPAAPPLPPVGNIPDVDLPRP